MCCQGARKLQATVTTGRQAWIGTPASGLGNPPKLLEDLLAVRHSPSHPVQRFRRQQQDGPGHQLRWLTAWVVHAADQLVEHGPWRGDNLRWRHAGDADTILVDFMGQALREA